ncbi:MAG: nicotinate-nucleotide--dimethylbenzimidazole phosphoribosyltransferase [Clostridia bacterium]|nr:nicotinate-nucleotide--dimethylbenzimidazole phosphoribosyltransferase [Clostridia bacterium]
MTESELQNILTSVKGADSNAMDAAKRRQAQLAKPPGSLGRLEEISVRLAGITGKVKNILEKRRILVFCADNGVVAEGVAVTPQSVTLSQAVNMTKHRTGMSALADFFGDGTEIIDVGINARFSCPGIIDRKISAGTKNIYIGPAMTREECLAAMTAGFEAARRAKADGVEAVGVGEMGIGNTTTSAAVLSALTGKSAEAVTGLGSGLTPEAFSHKKEVIARAVALNMPDPADVIGVLSKVGGFDLAAMTGAFIGCAACRLPAVADGFISVVAALCAVRLCPAVSDFLFIAHASKEAGSRIAEAELGIVPLLHLGMRLGEGSGCPLAFQIMRGACAAMNGMATFEEAAIDDGYLLDIRGKEF